MLVAWLLRAPYRSESRGLRPCWIDGVDAAIDDIGWSGPGCWDHTNGVVGWITTTDHNIESARVLFVGDALPP